MSRKSSIQTPLAKARGLGSARHGSAHWLAERVTSVALIPLVIWLVYSVLMLKGAPFETFTLWLAAPVNAILMILLILAGFYHAAMGVQVIIEDYVHREGVKLVLLIAVRLAFLALIVASIFSILKVAL